MYSEMKCSGGLGEIEQIFESTSAARLLREARKERIKVVRMSRVSTKRDNETVYAVADKKLIGLIDAIIQAYANDN